MFEDLATYVLWSVSRQAEVQPWEVRFAHPCRARARHPIHKAMGGHASPKQTVLRKRFMRYNLTRESHSVPDKTIVRNKFSVLRVVYCLFQEKQGRNATMWIHHPPRESGHYSRRHLLISRLRTSFRGVMDGREEEGLKRRKKLEDVDTAEESESSKLSIQARYFMASGDPRSMR